MELSKLNEVITAYIKHLDSKSTVFSDLLKKIKDSINRVHEQLLILSMSNAAQVPSYITDKFPDIKIKVKHNLCTLIDEEISKLSSQLDILNEEITPLGKMYRKIELFMISVNWKQSSEFLTTYTKIFEWMEKSWKYFLNLNFEIGNTLRQYNRDETHSINWFKDLGNVSEKDLNYVFHNSSAKLFLLLQEDIKTRSLVIKKT